MGSPLLEIKNTEAKRGGMPKLKMKMEDEQHINVEGQIKQASFLNGSPLQEYLV